MMRTIQSLFTPLRISILAFALFILLGAAMLMLPLSYTERPVAFVDALFTSTSAACVTGLVVLDTGRDFSLFGQVVILFWIQIGGLGIMTMSTVFLLLAGKRPSLGSRMVVQDTFTLSGDRNLPSLLWDVILFTVLIEAVGAFLLLLRFLPGRSVGEALYISIFHSVAAFCNAGFSTFSNNLEGYVGDWLISLTICFLIVSGGIGFLVLHELKLKYLTRGGTRPRLSLHTKLVLSTTAILILAGTILILLMEWQNTLGTLSIADRFLAALFQSVTPRTAGFNTLSIGSMANQTLFVIILLMFIGASSGSTGGGIKTGTFATLVALGLSRFRGQEQPQIFRRAVTAGSVARAMSVVMICSIVIIVAALILQVTELGSASHPRIRGGFLELLFEVVSAFGTVGLSMGVTPKLSDAGKLVITVVMFLGRLGPLVVAVAVSRRRVVRYRYAEEGIMIG